MAANNPSSPANICYYVTSMVFPWRICHLLDNNNEREDIRIISWPFKLIINYLLSSSSLAVVSLQTDTWQYPGPSSTSLSAPLALSSAGSWRSTFSLVSSQPASPVSQVVTFLYFQSSSPLRYSSPGQTDVIRPRSSMDLRRSAE